MNMKDRITLIQLQSTELCETASQYEQEKAKNNGYAPGCGYGNINSDNCHTALKRRITTLRAELLKLSKEL